MSVPHKWRGLRVKLPVRKDQDSRTDLTTSSERSIIIQQLISADKHVYSKLTQTGDKMNQGVSKNVPRLKCVDGDCVGLHVFLTVVHWWHIVGVQ